MSIIKSIINNHIRQSNPIKYWKKYGLVCGENCEIYSTVNFGSEPYLITLGNNVRVTDGVKFITHDGGCWVLRNLNKDNEISKCDLFGRISVGDNVHIGINSIIMPGVTIGNNCIIGCGAVVTKDIPDNSIAVGVPARVIKTVDEYLEKHRSDFDFTKGLDAKSKREYLIKKFDIK